MTFARLKRLRSAIIQRKVKPQKKEIDSEVTKFLDLLNKHSSSALTEIAKASGNCAEGVNGSIEAAEKNVKKPVQR